jgi:inosine-uridine nucleoside N-ribohydrolase
MQLVIDTDNALGSRHGDVDDAFAVAALLAGHLPVAAVASVGGNAGEAEADRNNRRLGALCGYRGRYLRGVGAGAPRCNRAEARARRRPEAAPAERIDQAADLWRGDHGPLRYLALGPLTNLAAVLAAAPAGGASPAISEVVLVGGNTSSRGRFPPWWPHEFNLTRDKTAARAVFASGLRLTLVPLDVARGLQVGEGRSACDGGWCDLAELPGPLGRYLRAGSARWLRRARWLRGRPSFAAYDLLAAACVLDPDCVTREPARVRVHRNLWLEIDPAGKAGIAKWPAGAWRALQVVRAFDRALLWRRFVERIAAAGDQLTMGSGAAAAAAEPGAPAGEESAASISP